jgi:hypothetical protein
MQSLFAQLFLAIQEQIKAAVPEVRYIDQDLGQLDYYEDRPAVSWPCAFIDFPAAQYQDESQEVQWAAVNVSIRIGFSPFSSANSLSPDISKENALQFYEVENKLFKALQGFDANGCIQPLTRISAHTEKRQDPFRVRELLFTTATEDDTAQVSDTKTNANLNLQIED